MAVLFSAVTITSDSDQAEFLVAGVPKSYADLEGWTAFESFMNEVDTEQEIKVHVAACLYGEGEVFTATMPHTDRPKRKRWLRTTTTVRPSSTIPVSPLRTPVRQWSCERSL